MKRLLALLVVLSCLATVPTATAATSVSGTVTVENGTADGARVTVVPVTQTLQRAGESAQTRVDRSTFSVSAPDAPRYAVRVRYEGTTHYEVLRNTTHAEFSLGGAVEGRVVDEDGTPLSGVAVDVVDDQGFVVTTVETDADGRVAVGPVESNETYHLRATVDGVPYRQSVTASADQPATLTVQPPTSNASALRVAADTRPAYVLQVVPPKNESGVPSVIQTITLRNTADRPFAGSVTLPLPTDASPYAGMVDNREAEYRRTDAGVRLNVTAPANGTVRVGAAYDLSGSTLTTTPRRDVPSLTVVVQGYDPSTVDHSANLRVGDAPVALLVSDGSIGAGESIRLDLRGARRQESQSAATNDAGSAGAASDTGADETGTDPARSNTIPPFPGAAILGAIGSMVLVGLVGYRFAPDD
ncbi:carboxypeptidase-like regulatory domain-containing protein [Haloplanus aerogenes]|uniref:Carboxypeptidase family protein n=1 Tax=Haloplanus aerogenes TaxID=660522 RepID=A0A3M0DCC3_9EURY|nr:carboxypeptidase-like regulatory domain-containing protein [Haloplanus aerogenes]AZH26375.1 carboxypeptidase regulatory-like domain-containing protein [Haloplanus aerogenes]RMB18160.1 carboxypeptidase family protein [Haloplanus aerogenes]